MRKLILALAFAILTAVPALAQTCGPIPALPDTERRTEYSGIVSQTGPFNVGFQIYGDQTDYGNWLEVWVNGVKKTAVTDYTVATASGPAIGAACRPISNAQVTFITAQSGTIEILGARRPRRASQFSENAGVTAHALNQVISDLTATERERWDMVGRTMRAPPGDTLSVLPLAAARAGGFLSFDGAGNPLLVVASPTVPILSPQTANTVYAGPTTGGPTVPTFRTLVPADMPYLSSGTGAVTRTVPAKLNDIFSALDFGAVADGVTDNTSAFQNLVNAACGHIALIPGNNYVMSGTVTITCPITLLGTVFDSGAVGGSASITSTSTTADMFRVNARGTVVRNLFLSRQGTPTTGKGIVVGSDGVAATCSIANGSGALTCTTSVFTSDMVTRGTRVKVVGAGAGGVSLFATITGFTSGTQVTVSPTASTLVTNATSLVADVYTDVRIEGNFLINHNIGIHIVNAARFHLNDNYILSTGTGAEGARIEDQVSPDYGDAFALSNTFVSNDNAAGYGVHYLSGGGLKATNNKFLGGKYNFFLDWNVGLSGQLKMTNNSLENCATSSIFISPVAQFNGVDLTGNNVDCGSPNIVFDNASASVVNGANLTGNSCQGGGGSCISAGKVNFLSAVGNLVNNGAVNPGIVVTSNCNSCFFSGNRMPGASVTYTNASTTATIVDNDGMGFANLPTVGANGSQIFVTNGAPGSAPCTGASTGAQATRQNGAWSCGVGGSGLTVGSTTITSGTNTRVLFDNSGVLGEYTISGSGNVAMTTSPVFTTPNLGTPSAATLTSATGLPLTTGVTGLLPYANGGCNSSTAWTTGSILFAGASACSQDNTNFFWDNTNKLLEVGTGTAAITANGEKIEILGNTAAHVSLRINNAHTSGFSTLWFGSSNAGIIRYGNSVGNKYQLNADNSSVGVWFAQAGVDFFGINNSHVVASGTAPALTSCGTSPAITGNDHAGTVTMGTGTPTGCVITFNAAYSAAPNCVVTWQATPLASQSYAISTAAITLTQTATSSNKVNYICVGGSAG